ncbi:LytR C-terminal domain-containing protein [Pseudolysinimonas sp.]|uniref:LytR C-terminal domain-containing protein n=1 Tax=Pseudolysinimonas sp. TaxID=2680009 RepID=UPI003F816D4A
MASFPRDQFDDVPDAGGRVGAHRGPARPGQGWIAFAWAALATGVLVLVGIFVLSRVDSSFQLNLPLAGGAGTTATAGASASAGATAAPVTDPKTLPTDLSQGLTISVFNGTATADLDAKAGDKIKNAGWPDPARADSSSTKVKTTVIYYSDSRYEGVARGLAQLLGVGQVQLSDAFPGATVTVLLGADYKG